jgi:hypothetical protein
MYLMLSQPSTFPNLLAVPAATWPLSNRGDSTVSGCNKSLSPGGTLLMSCLELLKIYNCNGYWVDMNG